MKKFPLLIRACAASMWVLGTLLTASAATEPTATHASVVRSQGPSIAEDRCGGALEAKIWALWDAQGRTNLRKELIGTRLLGQGDTYALYDIQVYFHNLEAMAERCQRVDRLMQLADDLMPAFDALQPLSEQSPADIGWVCKGGAVCNARNKLINKEVMLVSVQGLGLMSALAGALARSPDAQARTHPFVRQTVKTAVAHLRRWGDSTARLNWQRLTGAKSQDSEDASSALLFTDKPLWQLAIYANLAGIGARQPDLLQDIGLTRTVQRDLAQNIDLLLRLFKARVTLSTRDSLELGRVTVADVDRGFWSLYPDYRYAGYEGAERPATCRDGAYGSAQLLMNAKSIKPVSVGWDFSHARRLVQVMNALDLNAQALRTWYALSPSAIPPSDLTKAFAAQLLVAIWNGNVQAPLFKNYWGGFNGWYRVAYDDGTGRCVGGIPPFGLSDSFVTGGYADWARYYPKIHELALNVLKLSKSDQTEDRQFIRTHYKGLSDIASPANRMLNQLMFWPSLIQ
ncbi:hypothetical protein D3C86_1210500 [compost metagenome]